MVLKESGKVEKNILGLMREVRTAVQGEMLKFPGAGAHRRKPVGRPPTDQKH
jgi:hypothetical protein